MRSPRNCSRSQRVHAARRFCRATLAACLPSAVRVRLGRCAMVLFLLAAAAAFLMLRRAAEICFDDAMGNPLVSFKELHRALVLLRFGARAERAKVAPLAGARVALA